MIIILLILIILLLIWIQIQLKPKIFSVKSGLIHQQKQELSLLLIHVLYRTYNFYENCLFTILSLTYVLGFKVHLIIFFLLLQYTTFPIGSETAN